MKSSKENTVRFCDCGNRNYKCANCICCKKGVTCVNCNSWKCENKDGKKRKTNRKNYLVSRKTEKRQRENKKVDEGEDKENEKEYAGKENGNRHSDKTQHEISCFVEEMRNFTPENVIDVQGDGNCFFRCLSLHFHGNEDNHEIFRKIIVETEKNNEEYYSQFVDENFHEHIKKKSRSDGHSDTYATEAEIFAASEANNIDIFVEIPQNNGYEIQRISVNENCDHERPYMAIRNERCHFKKLIFSERPCKCTSEKNEIQAQGQSGGLSSSNSGAAVCMGLKVNELERWVNDVYEEIMFWKTKFLFEPPICKEVKYMIREMTRLIKEYVSDPSTAGWALKMTMILPTLVLQRPSMNSKHEENMSSLRRRMGLWEKGNVERLWEEANIINCRYEVPKYRKNCEGDDAKRFANLMRIGKINPALRILSEENSKGVLSVTSETLNTLIKKHPKAKSAPENTMLTNQDVTPDPSLYTCLFELITGTMVWKKAVKTQGGAGPSGLNANIWRCILSKKKFGNEAIDLAKAIASLARKLATEECSNTEALTACRLIPLDKNPGVRPIGIGETLTRIIGKCIMDIVQKDVRKAVGNLQVCAGHQAGGEAAIHAVRDMFECEDVDGVLLVDAKNAFNSINRKAMLHNISVKCPPISQYVQNTYRHPSNLYICGDTKRKNELLKSSEGTRQGDPIAMAMYSIGMSVLQNELSQKYKDVKGVAYADDLLGAGKLIQLLAWWKYVEQIGPDFGYFPNAEKSVLIVKPERLAVANQIFKGTNVQVKDSGHRYLGAALGSTAFNEEFVKGKVNEWIKEVQRLSNIAKTEPHAAYSSFIFGLKHKWTYLSRTVPNIENLLLPLEKCIKDTFIPMLTKGHKCSEKERDLLALPPRLGGLGIVNPSKNANQEYINSKKMTRSLASFISAQDELGEVDDKEIGEIKKQISKERQKTQEKELQRVMAQLSNEMRKKVEMAQEAGASSWLTSLPIKAKGFSLNKQEFTDAIALRYGWPIENLPDKCPCGKNFDEDHAMICQKGGFVCIRHDEVRDITAKILREICYDVTTEPLLLPISNERFQHKTANISNEARVDISARGFWTRGEKAYFDIRIFEPLAPSHQLQTLSAAHRKNELEKMRKYGDRVRQVEHGSFTPLVFTTSGGMGPLAKRFYSRVADMMAEKRGEPKSYFTAWLRTRLSFSLLRSSILCIRGSRTSRLKNVNLNTIDFEDTVIESRIM